MTQDKRFELCQLCRNRQFDLSLGLVCGLTKEKPSFQIDCDKYLVDDIELRKKAQREIEKKVISKLGEPKKVILGSCLFLIGIVNLIITGGWIYYILMVLGMLVLALGLNGRDMFRVRDRY